MKFELEESLRGEPDSVLLDDMRQAAKMLGRDTITMAEYTEVGKAHPSTIQRRFGSWPKALKLAGLQPSRSEIGISTDDLFEIKAPASRFSAGTYENRFGSWSKALREFVTLVNIDSLDETRSAEGSTSDEEVATNKIRNAPKRRSRREISERQRFRTLVRDGFRCKSCGVSPLSKPGTELHVDHIIPWSKGGETVDENLETKCDKCNLGKSNAFSI